MYLKIFQNKVVRAFLLVLAIPLLTFTIARVNSGASKIHLLPGVILVFVLAAVALSPTNFFKSYKSVAVIALNTVLLLVMIEAISSAGLWAYDRFLIREDPQFNRPPENSEWAEGFNDEYKRKATRYEPYVIWKNQPFQGTHINIDSDGNRVTPNSKCEQNSYVVFMFGGSTTWGTGVPDWATVPAYFQKELASRITKPVCVKNFGQEAWVSTQNLIELVRHLQVNERPNLVVFYDGVNDSTLNDGVAGSHDGASWLRDRLNPNQESRLLRDVAERTDSYRFLQLIRGANESKVDETPSDAEALGEAVANVYLTNFRIVKNLAHDFNFEYAFFWQPNARWGNKPLTPEEKEFVQQEPVDLAMKTAYTKVSNETKTNDHLFFIADVFDNTTSQVYIDPVHLTPEGNAMIAKAMMDRLGQLIKPN